MYKQNPYINVAETTIYQHMKMYQYIYNYIYTVLTVVIEDIRELSENRSSI